MLLHGLESERAGADRKREAKTRAIRVLAFSSLFPTAAQPFFGIFVKERVRHLTPHCELMVVSPLPWFPFNRWIRGAERSTVAAVEEQEGITIHRPRFLSVPGVGKSLDAFLYFLSLVPVIARLRRRFAFDIIDAHFGYPDGVAGVLLGRVFKCPVFITFRGDELRLQKYVLRRVQMRLAVRRASRVITVSDSLRRLALDLGANPARVRVIANGIDGSRFQPGSAGDARVKLGLPTDRSILLSVGNLMERKGHHRVLALLPGLLLQRPDLLYVVVGGEEAGDSNREEMEAVIRTHRLAESVRIVPPRPHDEIPQWMAAADLFCLATRAEGWCNAMVEALACGLPVVTTRVGGNPEFVQHGRDGFLVPYWDGPAFAAAILRALDTDWDRAAIAERTRKRGWDRTAEEIVQEFRAAMEEARESRLDREPHHLPR